jgi:hypothetical protein
MTFFAVCAEKWKRIKDRVINNMETGPWKNYLFTYFTYFVHWSHNVTKPEVTRPNLNERDQAWPNLTKPDQTWPNLKNPDQTWPNLI